MKEDAEIHPLLASPIKGEERKFLVFTNKE